MWVFKEIREITGLDIQMSPLTALLNMIDDSQVKREEQDLIIIMVIAARLLFAKNWKSDNQINIEEWYREMWDMAVHDKLTCEMKLRWGLSKSNDFKEVRNLFLEYACGKGSSYTEWRIDVFLEINGGGMKCKKVERRTWPEGGTGGIMCLGSMYFNVSGINVMQCRVFLVLVVLNMILIKINK